jgi:hypothetical protein
VWVCGCGWVRVCVGGAYDIRGMGAQEAQEAQEVEEHGRIGA